MATLVAIDVDFSIMRTSERQSLDASSALEVACRSPRRTDLLAFLPSMISTVIPRIN